MLSADICDGKETEQNIPPERLAALVCAPPTANGNGRRGRQQIAWVDVSQPTEADWAVLAETFNFHPLAVEDARNQNQRSKVDQYDGYLFLSLRAWSGENGVTDDVDDATTEIDIFLGPNYIVTVHDEPCGPLTETRRRWEKNPEHLPEAKGNPAYLLYLLLDAIVDEYFPAMDRIDEEIDRIESGIYEQDPKSPQPLDLKPALRMKKRLLLLRQTVAPMRDVLNHLLRADDTRLIPTSLRVYLQDVYDHTLRLTEQVDLHRDILNGVMDALNAQAGIRLNQTMKTMTGMSVILMTDALIAGIYGMNFKNMPELNNPNGYYGALATMAAIAVCLALFFRRIKWF